MEVDKHESRVPRQQNFIKTPLFQDLLLLGLTHWFCEFHVQICGGTAKHPPFCLIFNIRDFIIITHFFSFETIKTIDLLVQFMTPNYMYKFGICINFCYELGFPKSAPMAYKKNLE